MTATSFLANASLLKGDTTVKKLQPGRALLTALMVSGLVSQTACFASFPLTRKLYAYNKGVGDKWLQELFFLATGVILPVYGIAGLIDVVILNSMEFWTGKPAMTSSGPETKVKTVAKGDVHIKQTMTRDASGRTMVLEERVAGAFHSRSTLRQDAGATVVTAETVYADGRTETRTLSVDEAGTFTVAGTKRAPRVLTTSEVETVAAQVARLDAMAQR
jgi:hypothetical protein